VPLQGTLQKSLPRRVGPLAERATNAFDIWQNILQYIFTFQTRSRTMLKGFVARPPSAVRSERRLASKIQAVKKGEKAPAFTLPDQVHCTAAQHIPNVMPFWSQPPLSLHLSDILSDCRRCHCSKEKPFPSNLAVSGPSPRCYSSTQKTTHLDGTS
jgi:hypothetical protein